MQPFTCLLNLFFSPVGRIINNFIHFSCFCFRMTVIVAQGVDEFDTLPCGETQLLGELWFHVFHLHAASGHSQENPALVSRFCLITGDARHCQRFQFLQILWRRHLVRLPLTRRANYQTVSKSIWQPKIRHGLFDHYLSRNVTQSKL